jgi:hypothetical protein
MWIQRTDKVRHSAKEQIKGDPGMDIQDYQHRYEARNRTQYAIANPEVLSKLHQGYRIQSMIFFSEISSKFPKQVAQKSPGI